MGNVKNLYGKKECALAHSRAEARLLRQPSALAPSAHPRQELALKNAVTGTVDLVLKEKKNVLYVPSALVFDMGSKKVVYIEGKEGVKETREVTTGEQIQNEIEITGGLKENEQILTN